MRTVKIFTVIFIIVTVASWFFLESGLWGLASWRSVSVTFGLIFALAALLVFINTLTDRMAAWASWWAEKKWFDLLAFAAALLLFYLLRWRHDLWGERLQVAAATGAGQYFHPNAPLGMLLGRGFYWITSHLFLSSASSSTALLSIIAGGFYILASLRAARTIFGREKDEGGTDPAVIFLGGAKLFFFGGFIVIFFGAGGNTPIATLFALLFIIQAIRFVREETSLFTPAFLFLLALLSHLSAVYLLPAMIYLVMLAIVRKDKRAEGINVLFVIIGCWIVIEVVIRIFVGVMGPSQYLSGRIAATFSGLSGVSLTSRLRDSLNALLLTGPVVIAAMIFRIRSLPRESGLDAQTKLERNLLGLIVAPALLLFLAAGWRIDGGLRYHIVTPAGPALVICLLWTLHRTIPDRTELRRILTILIAISAFHTIPWILVNAIPPAAEEHLQSLPLAPGRAETILGVRALENNYPDRSTEWLTIAAEKDSANHTARYYLGMLYMENDNYLKAITRLSEAHEIEPEIPLYRFELANACIEHGWFEEAVSHLEFLTAAFPDSIKYWKRLGYAFNHGGMFEEAIEIYERVFRMEPSKEKNLQALVSAITNNGSKLHRSGDNEGARRMYELAIQLYPQIWAASNNLASLELSEGNIEKAYGILEKALERYPFIAKLNMNMGLTLEK
ncbi:MAG: tetratricopeptide repeat protein, partial [Candidatus Krumholzibacteria bacterium]|nr:tetratricopeptide repeat protein [Candidatus Krumholzibacteria bacterium]